MEKCNNNHKEELLKVLGNSAAENCFLYGDIENFSLDSEFMEVWRITKGEETTSILLRYYKYYVIYSIDPLDYPNIAAIIKENKDALGVSALGHIIEDFCSLLPFKHIKKMYLAELNKKEYCGYRPILAPQKAVKEDINDLFNFQAGIEEFSLTEASRESFGQEIINGSGRFYYIKDKDKVVATAALTAENSLNGMIIGVATDAAYRRKGYAKNCVASLCSEMIAENKSVILFYNNPDAGRLYKELGFKDINRWSMGEF